MTEAVLGLVHTAGKRTETGSGNLTSTIGNNEYWFLSLSQTSVNIFIQYVRNPLLPLLFPGPVPVPVSRGVNIPLHMLHLIFIFAGCQVDTQVSVVVESAPGVRFVSGRTQDGVSSRILFSFLSNVTFRLIVNFAMDKRKMKIPHFLSLV